MKKVILATTLALMTASSFAASDTSGFRVGGGFGSDIGNSTVSEKYGTETTLAVEGGYDFNSIFAVNVKAGGSNYTHYQNKKDKKGENLGTMYELAVEAEAGYTFVTDSGLSLKPYVALGAVAYDKNSSETLGLSKDSKGIYAAGRGAAGVRMTLDNGVYVDGRIQATDFSGHGTKLDSKDQLLNQGMLTVGYKF